MYDEMYLEMYFYLHKIYVYTYLIWMHVTANKYLKSLDRNN